MEIVQVGFWISSHSDQLKSGFLRSCIGIHHCKFYVLDVVVL